MVGVAELPTLGRWAEVSPRSLSRVELVDGIVAADRLVSRVQAVQASLCAELAVPGRAGDVSDLVEALTAKAGRARAADGSVDVEVLEAFVAEQAQRLAAAAVGVALKISPLAAAGRVSDAVELVTELPGTLQALRYGQIDKSKARVIADRTGGLAPGLRRRVEEQVIELAVDRAPARLRTLVDRAVIAADPAAAQKRTKKARTEREVRHRADRDGMGTVTAYLPAEGAVSLFTLLDVIAAARAAGDPRSVGARRADAIIGIADGLLTHGHLDLRPLLHPDTITAATDSHAAADIAATDHDAETADPQSRAPETAQPGPTPARYTEKADAGTENADAGTEGAHPADTDTDGADAGAEADQVDVVAEAGVADVEAEAEAEAADLEGHGDADAEGGEATVGDEQVDVDVDVDVAVDAVDVDVSADANVYFDARGDAGGDAEAGAHVGADVDGDEDDVEADLPAVSGPSGVVSRARQDQVHANRRVAAEKPQGPARGCPTCGRGTKVWLPSRQGRPVDLVVTMSLSTLAALDHLPAHLAGHGAITADLAHAIVKARRSVTLLVVDPDTGTAVGVGDRVYLPRQRLRDQALTVSPTCGWLGCGQPAQHCDLDHREPFNPTHPDQGGPTTLDNLTPYCRWHHLLKTHGHWTPKRNPDGTITLTSPTGHHHTELPYEFTLPHEWHHPIPPEPTHQDHTGDTSDTGGVDARPGHPDDPTLAPTLTDWVDTHIAHLRRTIDHDNAADHAPATPTSKWDHDWLPGTDRPPPRRKPTAPTPPTSDEPTSDEPTNDEPPF